MSKSKRARFHVRAKETILKRGMVDYSMTGQYKTFVPGDAFLTDERFYFEAKLDSGELFSFEIPLGQIYDVRMVGVPLFTRSMLLVTDEREFRINAMFAGRWVKAINAAREAARAREQ